MTTRTAKTGDAVLSQTIAREVAKRVVAQDLMVERLLIGLLTGGHVLLEGVPGLAKTLDRKSTRLNSSHGYISYAVFCLKKKKKHTHAVSRNVLHKLRTIRA